MIQIFILLLAASPILAQGQYIFQLHENARVMGMGGAFVAVADDPQAGLLNPAGLGEMLRIGQDFSFSSAAGTKSDQLGAALANPGSEAGAAFGTGFLMQGLVKNEPVKYYVPYTGASYAIRGRSRLGLGLRFPYRASEIPSIGSRWEAIGDLSALQGIGYMRLGAQVERMFGGAADMVPRRLRAGASLGRPGQYVIAYEWRATEQESNFNFHWDSSHLGAEIASYEYVAFRAGYVWGAFHHIALGLSVGLIQTGWRLETGWEVPTGKFGETRWSVGFGYRG